MVISDLPAEDEHVLLSNSLMAGCSDDVERSAR